MSWALDCSRVSSVGYGLIQRLIVARTTQHHHIQWLRLINRSGSKCVLNGLIMIQKSWLTVGPESPLSPLGPLVPGPPWESQDRMKDRVRDGESEPSPQQELLPDLNPKPSGIPWSSEVAKWSIHIPDSSSRFFLCFYFVRWAFIFWHISKPDSPHLISRHSSHPPSLSFSMGKTQTLTWGMSPL
jgi:hypothetical protein